MTTMIATAPQFLLRLKNPPRPLPRTLFFPIKLPASLASTPLTDGREKELNLALRLVLEIDLVGPCVGGPVLAWIVGGPALDWMVGGPAEVFFTGGAVGRERNANV